MGVTSMICVTILAAMLPMASMAFNIHHGIYGKDLINATTVNYLYRQILVAVENYADYISQEANLASPSLCAEATTITTSKNWWPMDLVSYAIHDVETIVKYSHQTTETHVQSGDFPAEFRNAGWLTQINSEELWDDPAKNDYVNVSTSGEVDWRSDIESDLKKIYKETYNFCIVKPFSRIFYLATRLTMKIIFEDVRWFLDKARLCMDQIKHTEEGCKIEELRLLKDQSLKRNENYLKLLDHTARELPERWCYPHTPAWNFVQVTNEEWSPYNLYNDEKKISLKIKGANNTVDIRFGISDHDTIFTYYVFSFGPTGEDEMSSHESWYNYTIKMDRHEVWVVGENGRIYNVTVRPGYKMGLAEPPDLFAYSVRIRGGETTKILLTTRNAGIAEDLSWCTGSLYGSDYYDSLGSVIFSANQFYPTNRKPLIHEFKRFSWNATLHGCLDNNKNYTEWKSMENFPEHAIIFGDDEFQWPNIFCTFKEDGKDFYGLLGDKFSKCKVHTDENVQPRESNEFQYLTYTGRYASQY